MRLLFGSLAILCLTAVATAAEVRPGVIIQAGGKTLLEYCPTAAPMKPYVRQLFSPSGVQVLRDAVPDHKHHHGLMFAISANGVNFWEETAGAGSEKPRNGAKTTAAALLGSPGGIPKGLVPATLQLGGNASTGQGLVRLVGGAK